MSAPPTITNGHADTAVSAAALQARATTLREELERGRARLATLERERHEVISTLTRITGALHLVDEDVVHSPAHPLPGHLVPPQDRREPVEDVVVVQVAVVPLAALVPRKDPPHALQRPVVQLGVLAQVLPQGLETPPMPIPFRDPV